MLLSELIPEEKRRIHELEMRFFELEKGNSKILVSDLLLTASELNTRIEELEKLLQREPKSRREEMKKRVAHLKSSLARVRSSMVLHERKYANQTFHAQKLELLGNHTNRDHIDLEIAESQSLDRSASMLNDYLESGRNTLSELIGQKERLKSVQRKVFDIVNYLGLSNTLMRAIENRDVVDKWIVYAGMVAVLGLIFLIYFFIK